MSIRILRILSTITCLCFASLPALAQETTGIAPTSSRTSRPSPTLNLTPIDGRTSGNLADHRGKIVVIDFWASWCGKCYPAVSKLQAIALNNPQWKGKVEFIAASVDQDPSQAIAAIQRNGWKHTGHCRADLSEINRLGIRHVPTMIVIAPDGTVAKIASPLSMNVEREIGKLIG